MKRLTDILTTLTAALLLTACSLITDKYDDAEQETTYNETYISFVIAVKDNHAAVTRGDTWWPVGGEGGNGKETGFDRENAVMGVTVILYKKSDADGMNTTSDPTLDFIRYFTVSNTEQQQDPAKTGVGIERIYATSTQPLGRNHKLDLTKEYYAIAIANCYPTELSGLTEGISKLSDIRNLVLHGIHSGNATQLADQTAHFIMSLEDNVVINFGENTSVKVEDYGGGDKLYNVQTGIPVERLSARIDFWAANSNGYKAKMTDGVTDYDSPGYEYEVYNSSNALTDDRFVITHITPFNLNSNTEYIFKRSQDGTGYNYLGAEDTYPVVIDPATATKTGSAVPSGYLNPLNGIKTASDLAASSYRHSVEAMHATVWTGVSSDTNSGGYSSWSDTYVYDDGGTEKTATVGPQENVIVAYAMENTLPQNALLYYYATGIAIEGDYYVNGEGTPTKRIYYGFLRHASKTIAPNSYDALLPDDLADPSLLKNVHPVDASNPMHFGVVRNNIYRIHIDKVYQRGSMKFKIVVKNWDVFHHEPITM